MLTISEYARARGVSRQYVSKLAKKGMPLDSFDSADLWREAHASSKGPTNPVTIARVMDEENGCQKASDETRRKLPSQNTRSHDSSESTIPFENALINARQAAAEAWRLLSEAMIEARPSKIQVLLTVHNKALDGLFTAESSYRKELERRTTLVPLSEAKSIVGKVIGIIVSRLTAFPQNVAPRCNPINPGLAMTILEDECAAILKDAQQAVIE